MAESVKTPLRMTAREFVTCLAVMAWAPQLIAPAWLLARKPPSASWEVAAAFPVPALTAEQVLGDALNIRAGEQLLVHGAGGITGGLLVALGSLRGAQVIATAGPASQQRVPPTVCWGG